MALLEGVDGAYTSQWWGIPEPSVASREPAMWSSGNKAYWLYYPGSAFHYHFHPGVDRAAAEGTPIRALEAGTVVWARLGSPTDPTGAIDGIQVVVEIRPGTRYSFNHLSRYAVTSGTKVKKGQVIGYIGQTGSATGPHAHIGVSHRETANDGVTRTMQYNPELFKTGGALANVSWILPPTVTTLYVALNGAGINIRTGPGTQYGVWGTSRTDGIYRNIGGKAVYYAGLKSRFVFKNWSPDGLWAKVVTGTSTVYIYRTLVHFA